MNNTLLTSLFCITILACAPACSKRQEKATKNKDDINTMIELDNSVFETETEENEIDQKLIKF